MTVPENDASRNRFGMPSALRFRLTPLRFMTARDCDPGRALEGQIDALGFGVMGLSD